MNQEKSEKTDSHTLNDSKQSWFERNVSLIIVGLVVACLGLLVAEFIFRDKFFDDHHPAHFPIENVFAYQAGIGFVAFVCVVFIGKFLRLIIRREEDYYDQ